MTDFVQNWLCRIIIAEMVVLIAYVISFIPIIGMVLIPLGIVSYILCFIGGIVLSDLILHPEQSALAEIDGLVKNKKRGGFVATLSFDKSKGIPINDFCDLVKIATKKHGENVMISVQDKEGYMHLSKDKKHLGYIDINTGSLVWDRREM